MIHNDISNPLIRLSPGQELKLSSPAHLLYVGRILKTSVVRPLAQNQVLININGNNINATTSHQFKPGEMLNVKVVSNQDGEIILQALRPSGPNSPLARAMSYYLPQQLPASLFYQILRHVANREQIPRQLQTLTQTILQAPNAQSNLLQQLSGAVHNSGLFLESRLLRRDESLRDSKDFKALLLQLIQQLPSFKNATRHPGIEAFKQNVPLPGELPKALPQPELPDLAAYSRDQLLKLLREQAEGVLARVISYQLQHAAKASSQPFQLFMDLPIQQNDRVDVIPIAIRKHPSKSRFKPPQWQVEFAVSLPKIGPLQGCLILQDKQVDVYFNTENETGLKFLKPWQSDWQTLLNDTGLQMGRWEIALGLKAEKPDAFNFQLVDIHL